MFLFTLLIPYIRAENSAYSLIIISNSNILNPGEQGQLWISISGKGEVNESYISIVLPQELIKDGYFRSYTPNLTCSDSCCDFDLRKAQWVLYTSRTTVIINKNSFKPSCIDPIYPYLNKHIKMFKQEIFMPQLILNSILVIMQNLETIF
jgi:hypothetical protein